MSALAHDVPPIAIAPAPARATAPTPLFPSWQRLLDVREPWLVPLIALVATRLWFWKLLPFASEDAYITYRYARNLVVGLGLTYNPGERVLGFSSPVWTLWNALGFALTRDPVTWSRATTLGLECLAIVVAGSMLSARCGRASAWCFNAFYAAWPYFGAVAMCGMENAAMLASILVTAALLERRHPVSGLALGVVSLLRPEGVLAAAVLGWGAAGRDRCVAALCWAAGVAALWMYFGSPIPQSVIAKAQLYGAPGPWAGRHWWEWIVPAPLGAWPSTSEGGVLFALAVVVAPAAVIGTRALWSLRGTAVAGAFGAALVVWLAYAATGAAWFWWYLCVPLGGVVGLAALGLPRLARGRGLYASLALFVVGAWTIAPGLYSNRASVEFQTFGRAAQFLAERSRPGESVMLEPIGMVGWRCPLIVRDEVGLVTPSIAKRRLLGPGWMTDAITAMRPDWLVVRPGVVRDRTAFAGAGQPFRNASERDTLMAGYPTVATIGLPSGEVSLEIRRRRDVAPAAAPGTRH